MVARELRVKMFDAMTSTPTRRKACLVALVAFYAWLLLVVRAVPWHDAIALPLVVWSAFKILERGDAQNKTALTFVPIASLLFALLTLDVLLLWKIGWAGRNHIFAGIFALSDAGEYYWDAERVLHGVRMGGGGSRRPLSVVLMTMLLRVTGNDVRAALLIFVAMWSAAIAFLSSGIARTHGRRAAAVVTVLFVLFARRYAGFVQSEGLGGPAGAFALGLFWRAVSERDDGTSASTTAAERRARPLYIAGMFALSFALFARPGPFFVLPLLLAWGASKKGILGTASPTTRDRLEILGRGAISIFAAYAISSLVTRTTASAATFSDSPAIMYGLLHGEEHYYVMAHNPELAHVSPPDRAGAILHLIGREIADSPSLLVVAPLRCVASYFYLPQGLFGFAWLNSDDHVLENGALIKKLMASHGTISGPVLHWVHELGVLSLVNAIVMALLGAGFGICLIWSVVRSIRKSRKKQADPHVRMLLFAAVGIFASMFFLPPWVTEGAQMHASVYGFFVALPAVALFGKKQIEERGDDRYEAALLRLRRFQTLIPVSFGVAFVGCLLLLLAFPIRPPGEACKANGSVIAQLDRSTVETYGSEQAKPALDLSPSDLETNLEYLRVRNEKFAASIEATLTPKNTAFAAYDTCHDEVLYVVDDKRALLDHDATWFVLKTDRLAQDPLVRLEHASELRP